MNDSEKILTAINNSIFFEEFTYANTEFYPPGGDTKELADNVVWLDDLIIIYQAKSRDIKAVKNKVSEENWFEKTVTGKAKKQIKDTVSYFENYNSLPVTNGKGQTIDIARAEKSNFFKIVIYEPNSLLVEQKRSIKFAESAIAGNIHIFHLEDYAYVCKYLITPTELAEYLFFREEFYTKHKAALNKLPEQYLLSHFFNTPDTAEIHLEYIESLPGFRADTSSFDMSGILNNFFKNTLQTVNGSPTDYHHILREIAKLNREELKEFKKRFKLIIDLAKKEEVNLPFRFYSINTKCGFVFVPLVSDKRGHWENALLNFIDIYKYKHRMAKCLGVVVYKDGSYFQMNWSIRVYPWEFNKDLDEAVKKDAEVYQRSQVKMLNRYKNDRG